jgi:FPC/CPF motif-containing protein YcgG
MMATQVDRVQKPSAALIEAEFRAFVCAPSFPCLAARGAVHRGDYTLRVFGALGTNESAIALAAELDGFVHAMPADGSGLRAFVAVFPEHPPPADEIDFERRLWQQLQRLHDHDEHGAEWDPAVSPVPESAQFAFSFASCALFVVGMHPLSSRLSRRFRWPALVFNPHAQFEQLRSAGIFERLRSEIRERDVALQGTPNPSLADFGEASEARQYSGRATEPEWRCPFHRKNH